jgi:tellurite resistance protein
MSMSPLKFLSLAWFTPVMGLAGLSLAWARAASLMGSAAEVLSAALAVLAFAVFLVLMVLQLRRAVQFPQAVAEDLNHPVRHAFVATIPVGLLLLIACGVRWFGPQSWLSILWFGVASAQLWVTWWVLSKWLKPGASDANGVTTPMWAGITPVLFVPVVGNVVAPLAGIALGHTAWSVMQASIGLFFWPLVLLLVLARRAAHSVLPDRLLPTWFISVAPPSVLGVVAHQLQAPVWVMQMAWAMAFFSLLWVAPVLVRAWRAGFHMGFWALSFPLAALASLTLALGDRMAAPELVDPSFLIQRLSVPVLAMVSGVIFMLCLMTLRGIRNGTLLVAEPVPVPVKPA